MPLMPKRVKYRQQQRGSRKGLAYAGSSVAFQQSPSDSAAGLNVPPLDVTLAATGASFAAR